MAPSFRYSGVQDYFFVTDTADDKFAITFENSTNLGSSELIVRFDVDGPHKQFMTGIEHGVQYHLNPLQTKEFTIRMKDLKPASFLYDQLYAAHIDVTAWWSNDPGTLLVDESFNVARFLAVVSPKESEEAWFVKTLADGKGMGFVREKRIDYHLPKAVETTFKKSADASAAFFDLGSSALVGEGHTTWTFDPAPDPARIKTHKSPVDVEIGGSTVATTTLAVCGTGINKTSASIDEAGFETQLRAFLQNAQNFDGNRAVPTAGAGDREASAAFQQYFNAILSPPAPPATVNTLVNTVGDMLLNLVKNDFEAVNAIHGVTYDAIEVVRSGGDIATTWKDHDVTDDDGAAGPNAPYEIFGHADRWDRKGGYNGIGMQTLWQKPTVSLAAKE